ncbi:hypothetical protein [uncultured Hyphomicrobium sp.]|jgi:hypothetical protein|uniref:hypothetical protein n=1 Tax=uncultured Hyphomicrobium sp. TaxID=194373 RepID=UPI0025D47655|nr:hypothetical protein [uncultured Hyphomicrobium sp.]
MMTRSLIRLENADLDQFIYRIYPLDRFKTLLTSKEDALVNPTRWQDPFEDFFLERTRVMDDLTGAPIPLKNLAEDWYGQCWSFNRDTDAMWRIYSPDPTVAVGVKARTTIRKLFENISAIGSPSPELQFFVGRVAYLEENQITSMMNELTFADVAIGGQGDRFADLLCMKRTAFQHESELRLLFQDVEFPNQPKRGVAGVFRYPLDAATVFEEVVLDPRLEDPDVTRITQELRAAGCTISINRSPLYQTPRFIIPLG